MGNLQNLVTILTSQHRQLQADLGEVASLLEHQGDVAEKIDQKMKKFKTDLFAHLALENESFYPELLLRMKQAGLDISKTKLFIAEMDNIGKVVVAFLEKYQDAEAIFGQLAQFKGEFLSIVPILNLRIESEEGGVYAYWQDLEK